MILLEEFNQKTANKYNFIRIQSCVIKTSTAKIDIELLIPSEHFKSVEDSEKKEIFAALRELIPKRLTLELKYKRSYVDNDIITKFVYDFIVQEYPSVGMSNIELDIQVLEDNISVSARTKTVFCNYLTSSNFAKKLEDYLAHCCCKPCVVTVVEDEGDVDFGSSIASAPTEREVFIMRRINTSEHEQVKGRAINTPPAYIADRKEVENNGVYCGKIVDYQRRLAKSGNPYFVISINDTTGQMVVKAFTKSPSVSEYDTLKVGDEVIVEGKVTLDTFLKDSVLLINNISKCKIDYSSIVLKLNYKSESNIYLNILPQPFVEKTQINLFDEGDSAIPQCLIGRDFVVFDLETTGLDKTCKVTEIGAIKIRDGKMIEQFTTLVDPQEALTERIIGITNITDDMLRGQPIIDDVLPDFYKFTRGAALVGHNVNFDLGYITRDGFRLKYNFDNKVYDTCELARKCITSSNYKLGTLCETLNIDLVNAHRALGDAEATARLFLEIARRLPISE